MSKTDVLIVGAGPVGMTLAAMLAHQGLRDFRIVDRAPQPNPHARAVIVRTRTLELLRKVGLAQGIIDSGVLCRAAGVYADGRLLMHLAFEGVDSPYRNAVLIPQNETERVLREHLAAIGCTIETRTLAQLQADCEHVTCTLRAPDGTEETVEARAVVGCDGAHSFVRECVQIGTVPAKAPPQDWTIADLGVEGDLPLDEVSTFLHPDGTVMFFPLGRNDFRLVIENHEGRDVPEPTLETLQHQVQARTLRRITLRHPRWTARHVVGGFTATAYARGRVFLAGDACHLLSPIGAQGMNVGMQDAVNLAWKLELVLGDRCDVDILATYNRERRAVSESVTVDLDRHLDISAMTGRLQQGLRNRVMRFLDCLDFVESRNADEIAQISTVYPDSLVVGQSPHHPGGGLPPGQRVPDVLLSQADAARAPVHLFDVLRTPRHVLLLCNGLRPTMEDTGRLAGVARHMAVKHESQVETVLVSTQPVDDWFGRALLDENGELHRRLGATHAAAFMVRPDGYLGYRASAAGIPDLQAWADGLFTCRP